MARVVKPRLPATPLAHRIYGKWAAELDECDKLEAEARQQYAIKAIDFDTLNGYIEALYARRAIAEAKLNPSPKPSKETIVAPARGWQPPPILFKIAAVVMFLIIVKYH